MSHKIGVNRQMDIGQMDRITKSITPLVAYCWRRKNVITKVSPIYRYTWQLLTQDFLPGC